MAQPKTGILELIGDLDKAHLLTIHGLENKNGTYKLNDKIAGAVITQDTLNKVIGGLTLQSLPDEANNLAKSGYDRHVTELGLDKISLPLTKANLSTLPQEKFSNDIPSNSESSTTTSNLNPSFSKPLDYNKLQSDNSSLIDDPLNTNLKPGQEFFKSNPSFEAPALYTPAFQKPAFQTTSKSNVNKLKLEGGSRKYIKPKRRKTRRIRKKKKKSKS